MHRVLTTRQTYCTHIPITNLWQQEKVTLKVKSIVSSFIRRRSIADTFFFCFCCILCSQNFMQTISYQNFIKCFSILTNKFIFLLLHPNLLFILNQKDDMFYFPLNCKISRNMLVFLTQGIYWHPSSISPWRSQSGIHLLLMIVVGGCCDGRCSRCCL